MKTFRERRPWLVGIVSITLIAIGMALAFSVNRFEGLRGVYSISADLQDAAGLVPGNEVRVAGVKVGNVKAIELTDSSARVKLEIEEDVQIPQETRLVVKLKTLLGQKFIDLQMPPAFLAAASNGGDPSDATDGYLEGGDVIPIEQTELPFEIYEAATEGTEVLERIDKVSLRRMLRVLSGVVDQSKEELGRALIGIDRVGEVLAVRGGDIRRLLDNLDRVSGTLAAGTQDFEGILARGSEVLEVLARRRATVSSLLEATNDLTGNLALVIQSARGPLGSAAIDLEGILLAAQEELDSIETALSELGVSQELFGQPLTLGRFVEGHVCAVTSEDTCVPGGSPEDPGLPVHNVQPTLLPPRGAQ